MTAIDAMALFSYTSNERDSRGYVLCNIVNKILAERDTKAMQQAKPYVLYVLSALHKMPRYKPLEGEMLYRGIIDISGKEHFKYTVGDAFVWKSFTSTSTEKENVYTFCGAGKPNVNGLLFEIYGKFRGYSISIFSKFKKEEGKLE